MKLSIKLHDEYTGKSKTFTAEVASVSDASRKFQEVRDASGLGSRVMGDGIITQGKQKIARISYNGKVWQMDGQLLIGAA